MAEYSYELKKKSEACHSKAFREQLRRLVREKAMKKRRLLRQRTHGILLQRPEKRKLCRLSLPKSGGGSCVPSSALSVTETMIESKKS